MSHQALTVPEIHRLSVLCRLHLSDAEEEALRGQIDTILGHIDKLQQTDTAQVPLYGFSGQHDVPWRADCTQPSLPLDEALKNAPERLGDGFGVPKIID